MRGQLGVSDDTLDGGRSPITKQPLVHFGSGTIEVDQPRPGPAQGNNDEVLEAADRARKQVQAACTRALELERDGRLADEFAALGPTDPRRSSWTCARMPNSMASILFLGWPTEDRAFNNHAFGERCAAYYGAPSFECQYLAGRELTLNGHQVTLDAHGCRISGVALKGGGYIARHDTVKWAFAELCSAYKVQVRTEAYGLFVDQILSAVQRRQLAGEARADSHHGGAGHGCVPDFLAHTDGRTKPPRLAELKGIGFVKTHYPVPTEPDSRKHASQAVSARAAKVQGEYTRKVRALDHRFFPDRLPDLRDEHARGPIQERLESYGEIIPLVFGHYAEINEEFARMLKAVAKEGAKAMWRSMLCQSEEQAVGILHWRARVYMGKAIHHAQANFMASQVRGAVPEPPAVRQAQQYARTKVFGARGAPAVMGEFRNGRISHH